MDGLETPRDTEPGPRGRDAGSKLSQWEGAGLEREETPPQQLQESPGSGLGAGRLLWWHESCRGSLLGGLPPAGGHSPHPWEE